MPSTVRAGSGWQPRLGLILAFATVALALILSACGGGSSDGSDNLTSADEVLAKASEAVNSVTSFRSESIIEMIEGSSSDGQSSQTAKMTLAWSAPNRFHLRIAVADEDGQTQEYISTDGKVALRDSMTGDVWTEYENAGIRSGAAECRITNARLALDPGISGPSSILNWWR